MTPTVTASRWHWMLCVHLHHFLHSNLRATMVAFKGGEGDNTIPLPYPSSALGTQVDHPGNSSDTVWRIHWKPAFMDNRWTTMQHHDNDTSSSKNCIRDLQRQQDLLFPCGLALCVIAVSLLSSHGERQEINLMIKYDIYRGTDSTWPLEWTSSGQADWRVNTHADTSYSPLF